MLETDAMKKYIIKYIKKNYNEYLESECFDLIQLKNICMLYKLDDQSKSTDSISIDDINISSPHFNKTSKKNKHTKNIIESNEFKQRYKFFVKIVFSAIKLGVNIFDIDDDVITIKNNYNILKSIDDRKKKLTNEYINTLKAIARHGGQFTDTSYEKSNTEYVKKMKILDKLVQHINKIINTNILKKTDTLLTIILPFFYKYTEFIEEYGYSN